jgi:hypothetical protein
MIVSSLRHVIDHGMPSAFVMPKSLCRPASTTGRLNLTPAIFGRLVVSRMTSALPCLVRDVEVDEWPFVLSSLTRSVPGNVHDDARELMRRCRVLVACDPEQTWHLYGCVVFGAESVHWLYTKSAMRRLGVGRALLDAVPLRRPVIASLRPPPWVPREVADFRPLYALTRP